MMVSPTPQTPLPTSAQALKRFPEPITGPPIFQSTSPFRTQKPFPSFRIPTDGVQMVHLPLVDFRPAPDPIDYPKQTIKDHPDRAQDERGVPQEAH